MGKRVTRRVTAAVAPLLEPGETIEVATYAAIGGPSVKRTVAVAAVTAAATGGAAYAMVMPKMRPIVLTDRRLIAMDTNWSGGPGSKIVASTPREQLRARRAKSMLYLAYDLTDPQGAPVGRLKYPLPNRADGHRLAASLGTPSETEAATPAG